ncbi:MAG: glycosyltransferase family 2 protein, partial [Clostridia bacterium]|nr:glycosyltransferase family 2 protein [Clostridia bacterium]
QKWGNGYWIGRTMHIQPHCFAPRHLIPAAFVAALAVCLALAPLCLLPLAALALVYGATDLCFALRGAMGQSEGRLLGALTLPFLFPAVHIVYGAGTICGLLTPEKGAPHA